MNQWNRSFNLAENREPAGRTEGSLIHGRKPVRGTKLVHWRLSLDS